MDFINIYSAPTMYRTLNIAARDTEINQLLPLTSGRQEGEGGILPASLGHCGTHAACSCDLGEGICADCSSSKPPSSLHFKAWPVFPHSCLLFGVSNL